MLATTFILSFFFGLAINVEAADKCDPKIFYLEWKELSKKVQRQAGKLKWNKENWNLSFGPNIMTTLPYDSVIKSSDNKKSIKNDWGKFKPVKKRKLEKIFKKMGLEIEGEECYDKHISHYAGYSWSDLDEKPMKYFTALGWDEQSWEGESKQPDYTCLYYSELDDKQKKMMKKVGYPEDEDGGGSWRWDEYPSTSLERAKYCNEYRCSVFPEQYTKECRYKYDSNYCDEDWDMYKEEECEYFYETVGEDCVAKDKCAIYGDYYVCENAFVDKWCQYDCVVFDQCQCESPSEYCVLFPGTYKTDEATSTCVPREWCNIFLNYYGGDFDEVGSEYYKEMMENCE